VAKFFDVVGYGESMEVSQGVWDDVITEVQYYGDVIRNTRRIDDSQKVNSDLTVGNSISIVADAYANEHIFAMRYVRWQGALWAVESVEVQRPRLILRLGGVYNGPTATAPVSP
jgi:hypothetical protein